MIDPTMSDVHKSQRPLFLFTALTVVLLGAAVWANLWKGALTVKEVRVEGAHILRPEEILALARIGKGGKLFDVDLFAAQKRVLENHYVKSVSINRDIPDKVAISIAERVPLAVIVPDKTYYLDSEGYVLPPVRSEYIFDLPIVTGRVPTGDVTPGRRLSTGDYWEAITILAAAQRLDDQLFRRISEVHLDNGKDLVLYTTEGNVPVIFGHGEVGPKLVKFDAFWRQFVTLRGAGELQYVDLRFAEQVVVRWNRPGGNMQDPASTTKTLPAVKSVATGL
jgi:cell division protein FtsQ